MTDAILRTINHPDFVTLFLIGALKFFGLWFFLALCAGIYKHFK